MKNNSKSILEKFIMLAKKNILLFSSVIFSFCLIIVAVVIVIISNIKAENAERLAYEALSEQEKLLLEQNLSLVKDGYPEVNKKMEEYFDALANNDQQYLKNNLFSVDINELDNIAVKSEYVDYFDNIVCYTQEGYADDSYYVYVLYDLHPVGFEEAVPGIRGLYYAKDSTGVYRIFEKDDMDEVVAENFYIAFMQQSVQDLYNQVSLAFNETLESNEELNDFFQEFDSEVLTGLVDLITVRDEQKKAEEEANKVDEGPKTETVKSTTSVNVRSSDSETAERLGTISDGTVLTRLEKKANGWSRVQYEGKEAYIKSEFLVVIDDEGNIVDTEDDTPVIPVTANDNETNDDNKEKKYVTAIDNVNIRAEADIDSERVGFAYNGDKLELVEKRSDGWTKIKYNGKDCYVKTDYVQ